MPEPMMELPLIILCQGSPIPYLTAAEAGESMEAVDIDRGVYRGYDANGRLLKIVSHPTLHNGVISLAEATPTHARELERHLRRFLRSQGEPAADDGTCDLPCLVTAYQRLMSRPGPT